MSTTADLIARTKRHLYSGETRDDRDQLTAAITAEATGLGLRYARVSVQQGATLAIDLEEMYVHEGGQNVVVARGEGGSTPAAHAEDAEVYINPKFSAYAVLSAVNEELSALYGEGLYRTRTVDLTYSSATDGYDLTGVTDLGSIIDVEYPETDGTSRWSTLHRSGWRLARDLPTATFASGLALMVNGYAEEGQTLRVSYEAPFTALSALADNVETVSGLPASAHDILPLGAAIRLTVGAEVSRNFLDQYETRRADEVQAGARQGQMRALMLLRADRIAAEKARLYAKHPVVRR